MTLGKKLSSYRKVAGLTQAQLGEQLNISAQAVSKWENDLAEPDIATLQMLAKLYKVSIDTLLDPDIEFPEIGEIEPEEETEYEQKDPPPPATIGFCKRCGIVVNEENIGQSSPVIMCKNCVETEKNAQIAQREEAKRKEESLKQYGRSRNRGRLIKSIIFASLASAVFLAVMIAIITHSSDASWIPFTIVGVIVVFTFISCLFFDCFVRDILFDWTTKSFSFPGLIFSFDLDGFIWLIGMKILFWILGFILGALAALVGIVLGMVCSIFVYPYILVKLHLDSKNGEESELLDD